MSEGSDGKKDLVWIGSSKKDLRKFPEAVKKDIGAALHIAQIGGKSEAAKALKGFGDAGVLEVIDDHKGDTYRAVYTVRFATAVYVLHAFKKKAKEGAETPLEDMQLVKLRLAEVDKLHKARIGECHVDDRARAK